MTPRPRTFAQRLQAIPTRTIYIVLMLCAAVPLFFPVSLPNVPIDPSVDFFGNLMSLKEGDRVLISADWTNSTRGESGGQTEALMRILMRKKIKFAVFAIGDPQAPQVERDLIARVAEQEEKNVGFRYLPFKDYIVIGYFPSGEGQAAAVNNNVLKAFAGRKDLPAGGVPTDVRRSPVFRGVKGLQDFKYFINVTGSGTNTIYLERIEKTPLMFMVTGVMVPENQNYYDSGQIKGMIGGVKGALDLETLMENGLAPGESNNFPDGVPGFKGMKNLGKGTAYYPTLHVCLFLLILAVVVGNVGMFLARKEAR